MVRAIVQSTFLELLYWPTGAARVPALREGHPPAIAFCRHLAGYVGSVASKPKSLSKKLALPGRRQEFPRFYDAIVEWRLEMVVSAS